MAGDWGCRKSFFHQCLMLKPRAIENLEVQLKMVEDGHEKLLELKAQVDATDVVTDEPFV